MNIFRMIRIILAAAIAAVSLASAGHIPDWLIEGKYSQDELGCRQYVVMATDLMPHSSYRVTKVVGYTPILLT